MMKLKLDIDAGDTFMVREIIQDANNLFSMRGSSVFFFFFNYVNSVNLCPPEHVLTLYKIYLVNIHGTKKPELVLL